MYGFQEDGFCSYHLISFLFCTFASLFVSLFAACSAAIVLLAGCRVNQAKSISSGCRVCSCNSGWTVGSDKSTCVENVCSCANGVGSSGAKCPVDKAKKCESCKSGFKLSVDNTACEGRCVGV